MRAYTPRGQWWFYDLTPAISSHSPRPNGLLRRAEPLEPIVGETLRRFVFCRCGASPLLAPAPGDRPPGSLRVPGTGDLPSETGRSAWDPLYRLQVPDYGDSRSERRPIPDQARRSTGDKNWEIPAQV